MNRFLFLTVDFLRNSLCWKKLNVFERIFCEILRAYVRIRSKNLARKAPKTSILANKWSFERSLVSFLMLLSLFISGGAQATPPTPEITSLNPNQGSGGSVTIKGENLKQEGDTIVDLFDHQKLLYQILVNSGEPTQITANFPTTTYDPSLKGKNIAVRIVTQGSGGSSFISRTNSNSYYTYTPARPKITSLNPSQGPGGAVTIQGENLKQEGDTIVDLFDQDKLLYQIFVDSGQPTQITANFPTITDDPSLQGKKIIVNVVTQGSEGSSFISRTNSNSYYTYTSSSTANQNFPEKLLIDSRS